jgi:hypothetical protein
LALDATIREQFDRLLPKNAVVKAIRHMLCAGLVHALPRRREDLPL